MTKPFIYISPMHDFPAISALDSDNSIITVTDANGSFDFTADIESQLSAAGCNGRIRYFDLDLAGSDYFEYLNAPLEAGIGAVFAEWVVVKYDESKDTVIYMRASFDRTHPTALRGKNSDAARGAAFTPQQLLLEFFINLAIEVVADGTISYIVEFIGTPEEFHASRFSYSWDQVCDKYSIGQFMESAANAGWETVKSAWPWYAGISVKKQKFIDLCIQGLVGGAKSAYDAYSRSGANVDSGAIFQAGLTGTIVGVASSIVGDVLRFGGLAAVKRGSGVDVPEYEFDEVIEVLVTSPSPNTANRWTGLYEEGIHPSIRKNTDALADPYAAADAVQTSGKRTWAQVRLLFMRGNLFNGKGRIEYGSDNCEIVLRGLNGKAGKRLDTYIPGEKIISRKATSIDDIQEST